jgi:short-subunit dehydrogenase
MRGLTQAMRLDLRGSGVNVLEVVLGKVSSTYFESNPDTEERLPGITKLVPTLTPGEAATHIVRGLEQGRRRIIAPVTLQAVLAMRALAPSVVDWLMWRTGHRRSS